jgi:hypothetical protein
VELQNDVELREIKGEHELREIKGEHKALVETKRATKHVYLKSN